jgi:RimJ/RimL family protein N-acetyltransferase
MFVPADFVVPLRLETPQFRLEPLGPEHNDPDYGAWSSSMEHIHATPGWWEESSWPRDMTLEENRADLQRHADDFANRSGFTYTVLEPGGDVVGCVYIYPAPDGPQDARVLSWVRASRAELDVPLWQAVSNWLAAEWPFRNVDYAPRNISRPMT